eukprot:1296851-Karenia_brevis.AAC.1
MVSRCAHPRVDAGFFGRSWPRDVHSRRQTRATWANHGPADRGSPPTTTTPSLGHKAPYSRKQ